MNEKKQLGFYIQYYRKQQGLTQSDFAQGYCVRQTLAKMETGSDSVDIESYAKMIRCFNKEYLTNLDRDEIEGLVAELYYSVLQIDDKRMEDLFFELRKKLSIEDVLQEEYLLLLDTLMQHYVYHKKVSHDKLIEHLNKKNMYPDYLRYLLDNMTYQILSHTLSIKKLARFCDKYSLFTAKEPLSSRNKTITRIAQKRYLEAYDLCNDINTYCEHYHCLNMQLESMRYTLLLYDRVQPLYVDQQFQRVEEFLQMSKDSLPIKKVSDVYYQMGVMNIINGAYEKAFPHFKNCHETTPTLLSAVIFMNFISLRKKRTNQYVAFELKEERYSPTYITIYKYFQYKNELLIRNENTTSLYTKLENYLIEYVLDLEIEDTALLKIINEETLDVYNHTHNSKLQYSLA